MISNSHLENLTPFLFFPGLFATLLNRGAGTQNRRHPGARALVIMLHGLSNARRRRSQQRKQEAQRRPRTPQGQSISNATERTKDMATDHSI